MTGRPFTDADAASGALGDADWDYVWDDVYAAAAPPPRARPPARAGRRTHVGRTHVGRTHVGLWATAGGGLVILLGAGGYAGSAWFAADGMLHALGRRDTGYLTTHLDAKRLLAGLEQDLRHLATQSTAGRSTPRADEGAFFSRMAHGTAGALRNPDLLGRVLQSRILDPMSGSEALDTIDNGPRHLVADGLTSFHVVFDADPRSISGMTLCFSLESLTRLEWRLVQVAWPELGGRCQG